MSELTSNETWHAVADALQPFLRCDPRDHQSRSCPAVVAVMEAVTRPTPPGFEEFDGPPAEAFGVADAVQADLDRAEARFEASQTTQLAQDPALTRRAGNDEPNPDPQPSHDGRGMTEEQR